MDGGASDRLGVPKLPAIPREALEAIRTSLPGKLLGRMSALLAQLDIHIDPPWLRTTLLIGGPALVVAVRLVNEWRAARARRAAQVLAIRTDAVPHGQG